MIKMHSGNDSVTKFSNCLLLRDHKLYKDDLWVRGSKIIDPESAFYCDQKALPDTIIDCGGAIISPGFIDVQIDGGFGVHFAFNIDKIEESIEKVAKRILAHGVTSFCPTLVSCHPHVYHAVLPHLKPNKGGCHGAEILGAHVEGPFISSGKRGAHDLAAIQNFQNGMQTLMETYKWLDSIAMITLAPELNGAVEICSELTHRGIVVSLGHSMTGIADAERAAQNGASCITHLFNGMSTFQNRDPGLLGLLASDKISKDKTLYYGLIADGHHSHPFATKMAYRTHPEGVVLVSDACSALGLPDGTYQIGEQSITVDGTKALLTGTDTLVGGCAPLPSCIQYFRDTTGCSLVEALEGATLHPAKLLKIQDRKGTLAVGSDADLIILQAHNLNVISTWIGGECVYKNCELFVSQIAK